MSDIQKYIDERAAATSPGIQIQDADHILRRLGKATTITTLCEVGTGTGWFLAACNARGIETWGVEINDRLADLAPEDTRVVRSSIEDADLPSAYFDAIVAMSVLEHVQDVDEALRRIRSALKPGGVFYLVTTSKFSPWSGEHRVLFYSWLPYRLRQRVRAHAHSDVRFPESQFMDHHQYTYPGLRRRLRRAGFERPMSIYEYLAPEDINRARLRPLFQIATRRPVRWAVEAFARATVMYCR
jgi:SAM-dependent methyltransferase